MDEIKTGQPTQDSPPKPLISTSTNNTQMSQILVNEPIQQDTFGRVSLAKGGFVDVIDEDTLEIAKSYLKVLEKKIKEKKTPNSNQFTDSPETLPAN
jgi:hypothetical protein